MCIEYVCIITAVIVGFDDSSYNTTEEEDANYCVFLNGIIDLELTVDVSLETGGSAQADSDFSFTPITLTFRPSSEKTICQSVPVTEDGIIEPEENFFLSLSTEFSNDRVMITFGVSEIIIEDSTRGQILYLNSSIAAIEGENVSLCFMNSQEIERNVTILVDLDSFRGMSFYVSTHNTITIFLCR